MNCNIYVKIRLYMDCNTLKHDYIMDCNTLKHDYIMNCNTLKYFYITRLYTLRTVHLYPRTSLVHAYIFEKGDVAI